MSGNNQAIGKKEATGKKNPEDPTMNTTKDEDETGNSGESADEFTLAVSRSLIVILCLGGEKLNKFYYSKLVNQKICLDIVFGFLEQILYVIIRSIRPGSLWVELQFKSKKDVSKFVRDFKDGSIEKRLSKEFSNIGIEEVTVELKVGMENFIEIVNKKEQLVKNAECPTTVCSPTRGLSSWKDYWINKVDKTWPVDCRKSGCKNKAKVGAHVRVEGQDQNQLFIIPFCSECIYNTDQMEVNKSTRLACIDRLIHCHECNEGAHKIRGGGVDVKAGGGADKKAGGGADKKAGGGADKKAGGGADEKAGGSADKKAGGGADKTAGGGADVNGERCETCGHDYRS